MRQRQKNINFFEITVTGESMWPVLIPGKRYFVNRNVEPKVGDIVVARSDKSESGYVVKKIQEVRIKNKELRKDKNPGFLLLERHRFLVIIFNCQS